MQQTTGWSESLEAFQQPGETKHLLNSLGWVAYVPAIYANKEIVIKMDIMGWCGEEEVMLQIRISELSKMGPDK